MVDLVGGGLIIKRADPSSFLTGFLIFVQKVLITVNQNLARKKVLDIEPLGHSDVLAFWEFLHQVFDRLRKLLS